MKEVCRVDVGLILSKDRDTDFFVKPSFPGWALWLRFNWAGDGDDDDDDDDDDDSLVDVL